MKQIFWYLFLGIVAIAFLLRFYQLGINPPELTWDEASWGYNAYTLGIDGRDEFGRFLPLDYLESFGDFKPPVYVYLTILPVKLLGLTPLAVRFPSALAGVFTVIVCFFLTREIFHASRHRDWYAVVASLLLAVSPWHIMLSRAAFEANVASLLLMSGVYFFLIAVRQKPWMLCVSILCFVLCIYTFNSARVVSPLVVISLSLFFWRQLRRIKKQVAVAMIIGVILMLPTAKFLLSPQAGLRYKEVNIFSDVSLVERSNLQIAYDQHAIYAPLIHNRRFIYFTEFIMHYFDNLSPSFLFFTGDGNPKFSTQDVGQMYVVELPFLIIGALYLFRKKEGAWFILPVWLMLAIIPAAVARETPHALRIEGTLPTWQIITAYGFIQILEGIKRFFISAQKILVIVMGLVLFLSLFYFQHGYYNHYPRDFSNQWQYGYREVVNYMTHQEANYDRIYMTEALGRAYIYYLFYARIQPEYFRKNAIVDRDAFGFVHVSEIGKYHFGELKKIDQRQNYKSLYINTPDQVPPNVKKLKTFYLVNGEEILEAYEK